MHRPQRERSGLDLAARGVLKLDIRAFHSYDHFHRLVKGSLVVKLKVPDLTERAEAALRGALAEVPFLRPDAEKGLRVAELTTGRPDLELRITPVSNRAPLFVLVEVKRSGEPRYARDAINQLLRYREARPGAYLVFAAPYISPETTALCATEGVGTIDFAGNCFLSFGEVFIRREGRPNPFAKRRGLRSLYAPKSERVLRVLLADPRAAWKTIRLAIEAGVSIGQVAKVKQLLADRELIAIGKNGFTLSNPQALLQDWSRSYRLERSTERGYYSSLPVAEAERAVAKRCAADDVTYALTSFSGAARYAPFVRYQQATIYVGTDPESVAGKIGLKKVDSGANVRILEPYDEGVFYRSQLIDGIAVASAIQVFLDLQSARARGEEASGFLLREVIEKTWEKPARTTRPKPSKRRGQSSSS
ncbi:MAG: hypothetical protein EPN53_02535 [Acidobacteria bacterium]|nr:MAG: hypothetical protein EPN53_02535 [Acidobacteriota bacterium]